MSFKLKMRCCFFDIPGLKLLTDKNNMPAMINCAHGKDRTGILSAMVLSVLGETEENIITDYALSQVHPYDYILVIKRAWFINKQTRRCKNWHFAKETCAENISSNDTCLLRKIKIMKFSRS